MKKYFLCLLVLGATKFKAQTWTTDEQYIENFALYAVEEMEKYKIPASITLAQGLLETGGGQSRLAKEGNNHFGIKCKENWFGKTMKHTDDAPNECFRVYDSPRQSYEDHSKFLVFRPYYKNLFTFDIKDYKAWAYGLKKAGYATNKKYAEILISKIEKYKLYEFDNITASAKDVYATIKKIFPHYDIANLKESMNSSTLNKGEVADKNTNDRDGIKVVSNSSPKEDVTKLLSNILIKTHPNRQLRYIIIPVSTNIDFIAKKFDISKEKLLKYNDLSQENLSANDIIFLDKKASRALVKTYVVQEGDTMHSISQKFAIQMNRLFKKNDMKDGETPRVGQIIQL